MAMRFAGLEISDDAIRCLEYAPTAHGRVVRKFDEVALPDGTVSGGDIKNEAILIDLLKKFGEKNNLSYVNVSVPEEKAYLFQTDVVGEKTKDIAQNIEFKLEENVPLSAKDAVFYFDIMPLKVTGGILRASVSVVPKTYIEKQISLLHSVGMLPIAFEIVPKSIARVALTNDPKKTGVVVHIMKKKTGIYVVSGGVVCFTSTASWGSMTENSNARDEMSILSREIMHTVEYWSSKSGAHIDSIVLVGEKAVEYSPRLAVAIEYENCSVTVANAWLNVFDLNEYIPPMSRPISLEYVVAAGLALDS